MIYAGLTETSSSFPFLKFLPWPKHSSYISNDTMKSKFQNWNESKGISVKLSQQTLDKWMYDNHEEKAFRIVDDLQPSRPKGKPAISQLLLRLFDDHSGRNLMRVK